ncbi:unnamed protein product [Pleuronectes platessa]|uniref:Uncharacterized protein n=1 Tax=Pleuronectes platessa TaxID=8262 RepID=A0A9N7YLP9_PLEPL|nr:unnamed protein product [Pleuronectes platessa]
MKSGDHNSHVRKLWVKNLLLRGSTRGNLEPLVDIDPLLSLETTGTKLPFNLEETRYSECEAGYLTFCT